MYLQYYCISLNSFFVFSFTVGIFLRISFKKKSIYLNFAKIFTKIHSFQDLKRGHEFFVVLTFDHVFLLEADSVILYNLS